MKFEEMTNEKIFEMWSKKSNSTVLDLQTEYLEKLEKSKGDFPNMGEAERRNYVLSLVQTSLKRQLASPAKKYSGYIIAISDIRDAHNFERMEALKKKQVNEEGYAVWKTHKYFKPGTVIDERPQRKYFGVCMEISSDPNVKGQLQPFIIYNDYNPSLVPPMFQWLNFRVNGAAKEGRYSLTVTSVTDFKPDTTIPPLPPMDILKQFFKKNACGSFKDLKTFKPTADGAPNNLIIIKGVVGDIRFRDGQATILEIGSLEENIELSDDVPIITAFADEIHPINFGIGSTIYLIGYINSEKMNFTVYGIIEDQVTKRPENLQKITKENATTEEDKEEVKIEAKSAKENDFF